MELDIIKAVTLIDGVAVELEFRGTASSGSISFSINNSYTIVSAEVRTKVRIVRWLCRTFSQWTAGPLAGVEVMAIPYEGDGLAEHRSLAFLSLGFQKAGGNTLVYDA